MSVFHSTPAWWPRAQAQGLVRGAQPEVVDDEEPNIFVIGLALLGALVCALAAGAFLLALLDLALLSYIYYALLLIYFFL